MLFLKDTDGDDKADVRKVLFTGWGIARHPRRPVEPALRPRQLGLGRRRLLRLRRRDERRADASSRQGVYRFKPDGSTFEFLTELDQQHVGPRLQRDVRRLRLDRQRRPELLRRHPEPLLRAVPELTAGVRAIGGPGYQSAAQFYAAHFTHAVHPPGRRARRLHRRRPGISSTRRDRSRSNTGTASPSSPSRPRTSSARAIIENRRAPASSRATAGT